MKKFLITLMRVSAVSSLSALALISCSTEEPVSFKTTEDILQLSPRISGSAVSSKGTMITGTTFDKTKTFFVTCYNGSTKQFENEEFKAFTHTTGSKHTYWSAFSGTAPKEYYWSKDQEKTFFAYSNVDNEISQISTTASQLTLEYTNNTDTAKCYQDILLAFYKGTGYRKSKEAGDSYEYVGRFADLNFRHPLSAIIFKKGEFEGWTSSDVFKSIAITDIYQSGTCKADSTFTWTHGSTLTQLFWNSSKEPITIDPSTNYIAEPFFIIPQNFETQNIIISVDFTIGGVDKSCSCTISQGELTAGKYMILELGYSTLSPFGGLTVNHIDWEDITSSKGDDYFDARFDNN